MAHRTKVVVLRQVPVEVRELVKSEGLPFQELLSDERILEALARAGVEFRDRVYNPMVTLWAFLSQVMGGNDSSCQKAVSRVLVDRLQHGKPACSPETTSYCAARGRLPEEVVADLARQSGRDLDRQADADWLWNGRSVKVVDGSTFTMADTPENQAEYPQSRNQKPGLGFPIARFVALLSLSVGTVVECAVGACRGKKTGEQSLFRRMWGALESGDIVLGDRLFDAYRDIAQLKTFGVDTVFGKKQSRKVDFRDGRKLGHDDHVVLWKKPKYNPARFASRREWAVLPDWLEIREVRTTVRRKGYRPRTIMIVTTLRDDTLYSAKDLTDLFALRWHCELDLRAIKRTLGMHHLSCKSPEMVRKEMWTYLLAYNLIRVRMAQAAAVHGATPRNLSFSAARTFIEEFAGALRNARDTDHARLETELLRAIAHCHVGKRPGRSEPRAVKKRDQNYPFLTKPRAQARKGLPA
jgi:hypothetical protein